MLQADLRGFPRDLRLHCGAHHRRRRPGSAAVRAGDPCRRRRRADPAETGADGRAPRLGRPRTGAHLRGDRPGRRRPRRPARHRRAPDLGREAGRGPRRLPEPDHERRAGVPHPLAVEGLRLHDGRDQDARRGQLVRRRQVHRLPAADPRRAARRPRRQPVGPDHRGKNAGPARRRRGHRDRDPAGGRAAPGVVGPEPRRLSPPGARELRLGLPGRHAREVPAAPAGPSGRRHSSRRPGPPVGCRSSTSTTRCSPRRSSRRPASSGSWSAPGRPTRPQTCSGRSTSAPTR